MKSLFLNKVCVPLYNGVPSPCQADNVEATLATGEISRRDRDPDSKTPRACLISSSSSSGVITGKGLGEDILTSDFGDRERGYRRLNVLYVGC